MATYDVAHRSAIVSGAGSGIGRAVARLLAANGAAVLVHDLVSGAADAVVAEIEAAGGTAQALVGDAVDPMLAVRAVAAAEALGSLRIAVNNAGIGVPAARIGDDSVEAWTRVLDVDLNGVYYALRAQLPVIARNGGGAVVNMSSVFGSVAAAANAAYVSAKHGLVGLTKSAALDYAQDGVRVTAVGPGFIRTPRLERRFSEQALVEISARHATGRLGTPDEVAHMVAFLVSDAATFITGSYHLVDGGYTSR